ncbi:polysaccharide biosynthesis protein [Vibrio sinaloensis]|nr:polysaccharide biosynthesis protein [Vibrio sinaloensis]
MRMIDVNVFNTDKTIQQSIDAGVKKYFCVSTDKAANPVNMMGASKRIMEMFLMRKKAKRLRFQRLDLQTWPFQMARYCMALISVY